MPTITTPCKVCGRPVTVEFDKDAPQEAVDKFLGLVTHEQCMPRPKRRGTTHANESQPQEQEPDWQRGLNIPT